MRKRYAAAALAAPAAAALAWGGFAASSAPAASAAMARVKPAATVVHTATVRPTAPTALPTVTATAPPAACGIRESDWVSLGQGTSFYEGKGIFIATGEAPAPSGSGAVPALSDIDLSAAGANAADVPYHFDDIAKGGPYLEWQANHTAWFLSHPACDGAGRVTSAQVTKSAIDGPNIGMVVRIE